MSEKNKRDVSIVKKTNASERSDEFFMREALRLAERALQHDEVPVGAVIERSGKIIARAFNLRQTKRQATYHAEILAINKACAKMKDFRLNDCTMFVTLDPCPMCVGAILNARLKSVVFGASINKEGAIGARELASRAMLNSNTIIEKGCLEKECSTIVSTYFKNKR